MMRFSGISKKYWTNIVNTFCHTSNIVEDDTQQMHFEERKTSNHVNTTHALTKSMLVDATKQ